MQLVKEFIEGVSGTSKDVIWFLMSDVEELERDDYSLSLSAKSSRDTKGACTAGDFSAACAYNLAVEDKLAPIDQVYNPETASYNDKLRKVAYLEIENKRLPKRRRRTQAELSKELLGNACR